MLSPNRIYAETTGCARRERKCKCAYFPVVVGVRVGCNGRPLSSCAGLEPIGPTLDKAGQYAQSQLPDANRLSAGWSVRDVKNAGVPTAYAHRGLFWWTGQVLAWLIRPDFQRRQRLNELKAVWKWREGEVLAVHVRRGDTCLAGAGAVERGKGRQCDGLEAYLPAIKALLSRYGYSQIYLASDDADVVQRATQDADKLFGLLPSQVLSQRVDRTMYAGGYYNKQLKRGALDPTADANAVLDDILLIADADAFVGKFTSNVARLAFALSAANKGGDCIVPFVSLDATWCADFGKRTGESIHGPFPC